MKIKISDVEAMIAQRGEWNRVPFKEIEWVNDAGEVVPIPEDVRADFECTGLNNTDFIRYGFLEGKSSI